MTTTRILGITDEQTTCDACGRVELRSTVILADENGEYGRYGSSCAARILGRSAGSVLSSARNIELVRRHNVAIDFRHAVKLASEGNHIGAMSYRASAVKVGLVRPDEIELNERLLTWARAYRRGECGEWGTP